MLTEDDEKSENPAEIPVVLLVNLGTPESPSPGDIRRFLREFLSDRRVIELHPLIWKPVLEGVILPFCLSATKQSLTEEVSHWIWWWEKCVYFCTRFREREC